MGEPEDLGLLVVDQGGLSHALLAHSGLDLQEGLCSPAAPPGLAVRREHLGQMTNPKAIAEGFTGTGEFFRYREQLHGRAAAELEPSVQEVWAIRFELVEAVARDEDERGSRRAR